jgi:hypothetical protein
MLSTVDDHIGFKPPPSMEEKLEAESGFELLRTFWSEVREQEI